MVYDEGLAERVRLQVQEIPGYSEKKMFGGLCFLINGNMACGVVGSKLMVRIGKENYDEAMKKEHVEEMDFTGKPMRGMIYISEEGSNMEDTLSEWVERGSSFAMQLPSKL